MDSDVSPKLHKAAEQETNVFGEHEHHELVAYRPPL